MHIFIGKFGLKNKKSPKKICIFIFFTCLTMFKVGLNPNHLFPLGSFRVKLKVALLKYHQHKMPITQLIVIEI